MSADAAVTAADPAEKPKLQGPITYTLAVPVELRTKEGELVETVRTLTLGRMRGQGARACLNAYGKGHGEFVFELICHSARIPPSTYNLLDAEDVMALAELATPFFKSGLPTPKT